MAGRLVAGMDLGSTGMKLLVLDENGAELVVEEVPTPWLAGPGGTADLPPERLIAAVGQLLASAERRLATVTDDPVAALAIAGMGETGMVVDADCRPVAPAFAWFDPRGAEQVAAFPAEVRAEFAGRTGLPLGPQASVAKLAYLRDQGLELDGLRWLNLPEFVATTLGGRAGAEMSLASRTGLLDQDTGAPWPAMLDALGDQRGLPAAPRHRGRRPRPDRRRAARSRVPGSPSRATTTSSRPRPTARSPPSATTSRWARPKCCCG